MRSSITINRQHRNLGLYRCPPRQFASFCVFVYSCSLWCAMSFQPQSPARGCEFGGHVCSPRPATPGETESPKASASVFRAGDTWMCRPDARRDRAAENVPRLSAPHWFDLDVGSLVVDGTHGRSFVVVCCVFCSKFVRKIPKYIYKIPYKSIANLCRLYASFVCNSCLCGAYI